MSSHPSALPDALLLDLYAGAAEPARWSRALDQICLQTGASLAAAFTFSFGGDRAQFHWKALDSRTERITLTTDNTVHTSRNPRLNPQCVLRGLNRVVGDEELFDPGDEAMQRLQQEMAALGCGRFLGALQEVSPGVFLALGLHRPIADRLDFSAAQRASVAALTPHLRQAYMLTDRLQKSPMHDGYLRGQLDRLRCGMAFCDAAGRVDWLNRSAERLLTAGPLRLVGSRLLGHSEAENTQLMNELGKAVSAGRHTAHHLRLGWGEGALHVAIQATAKPSVLALTLTSPSRGADIPIDALIQLFGLTPTEASLVAALATGSTVEEFAQQRGASVATARVHLKRINIKTGVQRQSDLVRLVWSSAAAQLSSGFADQAEPLDALRVE